MDADNDGKADPGTIDVEQLRRLADCLSSLGATYAGLAEWLKLQGISTIPGEGLPTAKRASHYLANFTSNVLTGYHAATMRGDFDKRPDKLIAKALGTEAALRNLSGKHQRRKGRPPGTSGGTGQKGQGS